MTGPDDTAPPTVTFRRLARSDFALLGGWLAEPLVARWWNHDPRPAAIERDFGPSIDGQDPTEIAIAILQGTPFGLIQRYRIDDNPEYRAELTAVCEVPPEAISVDYLIGEAEFRGRGIGARMIAAFVEATWSRYPAARDVIVPVSISNRSSWRALERAGFHRVARGELTPDNPVDSRDHLVLRCRRPET